MQLHQSTLFVTVMIVKIMKRIVIDFLIIIIRKMTEPSASSSSSSFCHPPRVSDKHGGCRVCQVYKSDLMVLSGHNELQPTALPTKRSAQMFRVHADCCKTPMISACWREYPVVGFFIANLLCGNDEEENFRPSTYISNHPNDFDWNNQDVITGLPEVKWRINTKYAINNKPQDEPKKDDIDDDDVTNSSQQTPTTTVFGHPGFPPLFLFGFLWRNFVSSPTLLTTAATTSPPFPLPPKGEEFFRDM